MLKKDLLLDSNGLTINGRTAPRPGITIRSGFGAGILILAQTDLRKARNVLVTHVRVIGEWDRMNSQEIENSTTIVIDCENNDKGRLDTNLNIVLDHVTLSNSPDGGPDLWGACRGVTVQWSLIHHNVHPMTISASTNQQHRARLSIHHNVFWNNRERNPQVRGNVRQLDLVNNVIGGWTWYGIRLRGNAAVLGEMVSQAGDPALVTAYPREVNLIGNVLVGNGSPADANALEFLNHPDRAQVFDTDNIYPSAERDRGTAPAVFGAGLEAVRQPASEWLETLFDGGRAMSVGTHYPTPEELDLAVEIRTAIDQLGYGGDSVSASNP